MRRQGRPGKTPRRARALRGFNALLCFAFLALSARFSVADEGANSEPLELIELSVMQITGDIDLDTVLSPIEVTSTRRPVPRGRRPTSDSAVRPRAQSCLEYPGWSRVSGVSKDQAREKVDVGWAKAHWRHAHQI